MPWELSQEDPIVELRLLFHRQFGMAFCVMLMVGAILFGSNQIMPQLLQTSFPYTAMLSGLAMMPGGLAMLVIMPIAGQVTGRFQPKYLMVLGLTGIALSMWYSTSLTPDASFDYFGWVRVYQMVGLPFLFIPINTVAYDGLAPTKTNQASALMNVSRNLGGSIGISLANVVLTQRSDFHQSRLVEHIEPSSPAYQSTLQQLTKYFMQHGASAADAKGQAMGVFGQMVQTPSHDFGLYRRVPCLRHCGRADDPAGAHSGQACADRRATRLPDTDDGTNASAGFFPSKNCSFGRDKKKPRYSLQGWRQWLEFSRQILFAGAARRMSRRRAWRMSRRRHTGAGQDRRCHDRLQIHSRSSDIPA